MLLGLDAINEQNDVLHLLLQSLSGGVEVRDIDGLDPVKANLSSSSFAMLDGEEVQGSKLPGRNIVITLGLSTSWLGSSISARRTMLYEWFMPGAEVTLRFNSDDMQQVEIKGNVETTVSPRFTKDPTMQISVFCPQPDFVSTVSYTYEGLSTANAYSSDQIDYKGNRPSGVQIDYDADIAQEWVTFGFGQPNTHGQQILENIMNFRGSLAAGDDLIIVTRPREKRITRFNPTTLFTSMLYAISPDSEWLTMLPGGISVNVNDATGGNPYSISYLERYGAIG